jgi:hypothetical protein
MKSFLLAACLVAVSLFASTAPASAQYLQGGQVTFVWPQISGAGGATVAYEFVLNIGDYYPMQQGFPDFPGELNWGDGQFHAEMSNSGVCGTGTPVNPSCNFVGTYEPAKMVTRQLDADCQEISFPVVGTLTVNERTFAPNLNAIYSQQVCREAGVAFSGGGGLTIHLE